MNMMRSIFNSIPNPLANVMNWFQQLQTFSKNPIGNILSMKNVNVPPNFNGTPKDLANYLINTGQMTKEQFEQYGQTATQIQNMKNRF